MNLIKDRDLSRVRLDQKRAFYYKYCKNLCSGTLTILILIQVVICFVSTLLIIVEFHHEDVCGVMGLFFVLTQLF